MRRKDDGSGDIYLLSLDTFMIMSVVGLSLGMIFFLLNPSFKKGEAAIKIKMLVYEIPENEYYSIEKNISSKIKIDDETWAVNNGREFLKIDVFNPGGDDAQLSCRLYSDSLYDNKIDDLEKIISLIKNDKDLKPLQKYKPRIIK